MTSGTRRTKNTLTEDAFTAIKQGHQGQQHDLVPLRAGESEVTDLWNDKTVSYVGDCSSTFAACTKKCDKVASRSSRLIPAGVHV